MREPLVRTDARTPMPQNRKYTLVESFCGPGGLSLGLESAGFELLRAFDIDEQAVATHSRNLKERCVVADAAEVRGKALLKELRLDRGELDLFAGGPPCQGFSKQKRGAHLGDTRNELVLEYVRLLKETKPRAFLLENVAVFGQKRGRKYLESLAERLEEYRLYPGFYNCADFGLAQTRQRFVLVGLRRDCPAAFRRPGPTVDAWPTVGEVIGDLPEPPEDFTDHPRFANHQRARVTPLNIERFSHVPQGGGWQDIPARLRLRCHQDVDTSRGGWPDVYGRLEWKGQCPTITGGFDSFTRGRYGHPLKDRPLTPREAARLQGFPDDFIFVGTRGDIRSQIGNAVPPPLAAALGREIARTLRCWDGLEEDVADDEMVRQPTLF